MRLTFASRDNLAICDLKCSSCKRKSTTNISAIFKMAFPTIIKDFDDASSSSQDDGCLLPLNNSAFQSTD